jgi:ATPase family associated with various cellular activities (AAA)
VGVLSAQALAKEAGARFINLRASTLQSKWFGDTQKLVYALFSLAYKIQPTIIFIGEAQVYQALQPRSFRLARGWVPCASVHSLYGPVLAHGGGLGLPHPRSVYAGNGFPARVCTLSRTQCGHTVGGWVFPTLGLSLLGHICIELELQVSRGEAHGRERVCGCALRTVGRRFRIVGCR